LIKSSNPKLTNRTQNKGVIQNFGFSVPLTLTADTNACFRMTGTTGSRCTVLRVLQGPVSAQLALALAELFSFGEKWLIAYKNSGSQFGNQEAYNLISYYQSETDLRLISSLNYHKEEKQTDCSFHTSAISKSCETAISHNKINSIVIQRV